MRPTQIFTNSFFKIILLAYLFLKPFYFFDSGALQISDYVLFPSIVLFFFLDKSLYLIKDKALKYLFVFIAVVFIINVSYTFFLFDTYQWDFIMPILYYVYNASLFLFCLFVFKAFGAKDFNRLLVVLFASLFIQFLMILFDIDKGVVNNFKGRDYNYFNNPNQLAYYCILLLTFLFFFKNKISAYVYLIPLSISLAIVIIVCATSFPALLGAIFFLLVYVFELFKRKDFKYFFMMLLPPLLIVAVKYQDVKEEYNRIADRFDNPQHRVDNSIEDRGYDRIINYPQYLLFGAGEGKFERFVSVSIERPQEIHNTFMSVFFNYGIVGGLFFILFLYFLFKNVEFYSLLLVTPIIVYNLVHNGIRFSLLWVVIAYIYYNSKKYQLNFK